MRVRAVFPAFVCSPRALLLGGATDGCAMGQATKQESRQQVDNFDMDWPFETSFETWEVNKDQVHFDEETNSQ
jgi:hypothetical protein